MKHQDYLRHQKGLALLSLWKEQWSSVSDLVWDKRVLALSPLVAQRFCFGIPTPVKKSRRVSSSALFLGVQDDEEQWMKRIPWKKIVWDPSEKMVWLVSASSPSVDPKWPDVPSVVVGLPIAEERHALLEAWNKNSMDMRSVWWDDDVALHVGTTPLRSVLWKRGSLNDQWSPDNENVKTMKDLAIERLRDTSVHHDPGFQGELPTLDKDQRKILDPVAVEKPWIIEEQYPNLFHDFLDKPSS